MVMGFFQKTTGAAHSVPQPGFKVRINFSRRRSPVAACFVPGSKPQPGLFRSPASARASEPLNEPSNDLPGA